MRRLLTSSIGGLVGAAAALHVARIRTRAILAVAPAPRQNVGVKMPGWLQDWLVRHQSPVSFWLHVIGIPLTIFAIGLGVWQLYHDLWDLWWRPLLLLVAGYLLQWIGHVHEGNDMGEVIVYKRLTGKPYVAVSPRYAAKRVSSASSAAMGS